jgi:hypothetical protein
MPGSAYRRWTAEQTAILCALVERGVSPARASVVLSRPRLAVQSKARALGKPFTDSRLVKASRLAREASEQKAVERPKPESSSL